MGQEGAEVASRMQELETGKAAVSGLGCTRTIAEYYNFKNKADLASPTLQPQRPDGHRRDVFAVHFSRPVDACIKAS